MEPLCTLDDWLAHVEKLHEKPIDLGLDRMKLMIERMGIRFECPVVTVAGTNGKGSTCAMIERICRAAGLRMNGSAAVSLCYVAAGRFAAWAEKYIRPWDFSAGWLLVTEAGGAVAGFGGGSCDPDGDNIVAAATPDLLRELLAAIG